MELITSPDSFAVSSDNLWTKRLFLAGSIVGAKPWQKTFAKNFEHSKVIIFNPLRDVWDQDNWDTGPEFDTQVHWEQNHIEIADIMLVYFQAGTLSPISLLELGMAIGSNHPKNLLVVVEPEFWRKRNVEIVCKRENVRLVYSLDAAVPIIKNML